MTGDVCKSRCLSFVLLVLSVTGEGVGFYYLIQYCLEEHRNIALMFTAIAVLIFLGLNIGICFYLTRPAAPKRTNRHNESIQSIGQYTKSISLPRTTQRVESNDLFSGHVEDQPSIVYEQPVDQANLSNVSKPDESNELEISISMDSDWFDDDDDDFQ